MTKKIFHSILLAAAAVLLSSLLIITGFLYDYFGKVQQNHLEDQLDMAAAAVENGGIDFLKEISSPRYRLTWIAADGSVLLDTRADQESLQNHGDREEVRQALTRGTGQSTRYSATLLEKTMYRARRLSDGTVLRISASQATVGTLLLGMFHPFLLVLLLALALSLFLARRLSRKIVSPLNGLDLEHPLDNDTYEELSPLLGRLHRQRVQIDQQMQALQKKSEEFNQIISFMEEGLVLLDGKGKVLSINPAARTIFNAEEDCIGKDFLTVDRTPALNAALTRAMEQGHGALTTQRNGRIYRYDISRIQTGREIAGAVLLAFDNTEQAEAEKNRREFTANVSHELKTPLQGIIGSAELMEQGLVKPVDMPRFVGHIRTEAQRLVSLIGDIIRLSQLDEGDPMPREEVELGSLLREAASDLADAARKRHVELTVEAGAPLYIRGVRRLLYEIVYNLMDNGIRYNVEGGTVLAKLVQTPGQVQILVQDTGIGIPEACRSRVFERFFRVDKSHSKATGGTGLGLSIVKHAVQYHGGTVTLTSQEHKGTTVTVSLPADR